MKINADRIEFNALLGVPNQQFRVPPYQRPYAWQAEQIDELLDDLGQTIGTGHFMGSLVLNCEDPQTPEVIDGQQRLTTLLLILALIRDEYHRLRPELVGRVQQFMENPYAEPDRRFKFRSGEGNWAVLRDFVLRSPSDASRKMSNDLAALGRAERNRNAGLLAAIERVSGWLRARLDGQSSDAQVTELMRLEKAIVTGLEFVAIKVQQVADAFVIFETLNDRGLALSAGDLLKNHLLANAAQNGDSVEDLSEHWEDLLASLNGADVTRFLRHYLLIRNSRAQKDDVFSYFKKEVASVGARALMSELLTMGRYYGQFVDPSAVESRTVKAVLDDLATLRAVMCYTALMAARRHLTSDADFVAYARLAESLTYRYSSICSKDSKELERCYHQSAKLLTESNGKALDQARAILRERMPSSDEFISAFQRQAMGQKYLVNYTFRRLEEHLDGEEKTTKEPGSVHIEHIVPQTLNDGWRTRLASRLDEHQAYVGRWGNLTLLGGKKNVKASNDVFERKREIYAQSSIHLTQRLAELQTWDFDSIEVRQRELAQVADQIWPKG